MTVPYPQQYGVPPQQVQQPYPPQYPQYPAQQFPPQYAPPAYPQQPQAPTQPLAQGTLDAFYNQPSTGGGASLKFTDPQQRPIIGKSFVFRVTRPLTNGDVQQQTDTRNVPQTFRDGSPKYVMKVPGQLLEADPAYPDGLVQWFCKGQARDELVRAMAEAGAETTVPEAESVIRVTLVATRPSGPGMNPANVFQIQYYRPQSNPGATQPAAQASPPQPPAPPANQPLPPAQQQFQQPAQAAQTWSGAPGTYPPASYTEAPRGPVATSPAPGPVQPQYQPPAPAPQQQQQQPAQVPAPQGPPPVTQQDLGQLTPEQQAIFARLTGGQQPQPQGANG